MIGIVNQHFGDLNECINHIKNYLDVLRSKEFKMVLVIDQALTHEQMKELDQYQSSQLVILYHNTNLGLSWARNTAIKYLELLPDCKQVLFDSTNSTFTTELNDSLADLIYSNDGFMTFQCSYNDPMYQRDKSIVVDGKIKFDTYLNCINKPDMYLVCEFNKLISSYRVIEGEKYYLEDTFLHKCCKDGFLNMNTLELGNCWYNDKGMSKTFNRDTVLKNKTGFLESSIYFIDLFYENKFNLSYELLKRYVTNIVTLSTYIPLRKYEGTLIYPLLLDRINKWCNDKSFNHQLSFIEDKNV